MIHYKCKNMNASFLTRFLPYLAPAYNNAWINYCINNSIGIGNPNYLQMYQYFLNKYKKSDSDNRTTNID